MNPTPLLNRPEPSPARPRPESAQVGQLPPPPPVQDDAGAHDDEIDLNVPEPRPIWVVVACLAALAVLGALLVIGFVPRERAADALRKATADAATAPVLVEMTHPHRESADETISLPGTLHPWQETSIYARSTGYLKKFVVDINDTVKAGQLMAEIDSPEVDQQLKQAQAALAQAKASVALAESNKVLADATYGRYKNLAEMHGATPQDLDEKRAAADAAVAQVAAANANVSADDANVARLAELQRFEKVTAPFDGVITARTYDVGSLILADPTTTDIKPMYKIAANDVLRVFVNVPQSSALRIAKGMKVRVTARELPGRIFDGVVMGTTNYLDITNRTLLTEVKVLNARRSDGGWTLLPGMYATVDFEIKREHPPLVIPAPALVNNADGTQVVVVRDGRAHFVKVQLGDDLGKEIEVTGGLKGDETIVETPGEQIIEGVAVSSQAPDHPEPGGK